jgi:8-oxo-dGTP diphosphatase
MAHFAWSNWIPQELATLCFIRQGDRVLMIRKKRGLGAGKINGVGGKLEPAETELAGIQREALEELRITLIDPEARARLHFQFQDGYSLRCTVYVATRFEGEPQATPEADPLWFDINDLPFAEMWEDDRLWLSQLLNGQRFQGYFLFDGERMLSYLIEWDEGAKER